MIPKKETADHKSKKGWIETAVFVGGTAVMILELIGSRILAPYLGTSIFVWSALIGIILGALSLGYYLGGYFSRRGGKLSFLALILFLAGISVSMIILFRKHVLLFAMALGAQMGSVIATTVLFALPSILLGMVSPYAIHLKIDTVERSGGVAGNLYALSTIGSILGTFLAGFYLIPTFNTDQILIGLSVVLFATSLFVSFDWKKIYFFPVVIFLSVVFSPSSAKNVFEMDSAYNHIRVVDFRESKSKLAVRALFLATVPHSLIYLDSNELYSNYYRLYRLDNLFMPNIRRGLTLGGGAYIAPVDFLDRYPNAEMTVVEIDPKVTQVAKDYFRLQPYPRLDIHHQDARMFLNQTNKTYDVIYGDVFSSFFAIPFHLTTQEALRKIHDILTDKGVFILNLVSSLEGKKSLFFQAEYKTLQTIFPQLYIFLTDFPTGDLSKAQNIIIIATKYPERLTKEVMLQRASDKQKELLDRLWEKKVVIDPNTKILTDDFAPVDYYLSKLL